MLDRFDQIVPTSPYDGSLLPVVGTIPRPSTRMVRRLDSIRPEISGDLLGVRRWKTQLTT